MPSLSALRKFKASFDDLGGQGAELAAAGVPFNDLKLPDFEPEPMPDLSRPDKKEYEDFEDELTDDGFDDTEESDDANISDDADTLGGADTLDDAGTLGTAPPPATNGPLSPDFLDNLDFSAFTGAQPRDIPSAPENEEITGDTAPAAETVDTTEDFDLDGLDGFDLSEDSPATAETPTVVEKPEAGDTPAVAAEEFSLDDLDGFDLSDESPVTAETPTVVEKPETGDTPAAAAEEFSLDDLDGFDLSDESPVTAETPTVVEKPEAGDAPAVAAEEFDIGDLDGLDLPGESPETPAVTEKQEPGDTAPAADTTEDFDIGDLDGLDLSDESLETPAVTEKQEPGDTAPAADTTEDFDIGDLDGLDLPEDSPAEPAVTEESSAADSEDTDAPITDIPADINDSADPFDNFEPEKKGKQNGKKPAVQTDTQGGDDVDHFNFPELDNVMGGPSEVAKTAPVSGKPKGRGWTNPNASLEELIDIQLEDAELDSLHQTLSGYPVNLRIACEEIIAEQVVNPMQMAQLIRLLVRGAHPKATASLAGDILGKTITVPRSFSKKTGEELEAEQSTFIYIFVKHFLPILRLFLFITVAAGCLFFLVYTFIYKPLRAESIYKLGLDRITAGEYQRANDRFSEAFGIHRKKKWFYTYAEKFRDERQYALAEKKYDDLLRYYPRDKKGVLDYAALETYYLRNYDKADSLLRRNILDYNPDDYEGLLAAGDNSLEWGEVEPARYDDARFSYARLLEKYGWTPPIVERMMKYFIRTDNLKEVLPLRRWFEANPKKRPLSAETTAELGGYLLDKQFEVARGVPNEYVEHIESVRALLLNAALQDPSFPESHYHLARYYHNFGNAHDERVTLEVALRQFENAREESVRRITYRIDAHRRLADVLIRTREFIPAEEQLIKGINLYQDALSRFRDPRSRERMSGYQFGRLYANLGDLEYFVKTGDMDAAIRYYRQSEDYGWAPPEMLYRMGSAYYQLENWKDALERIFAASKDLPLNDRILFALGNVSFKRGDYFAAQGYYNRLLGILESRRARLPVLLPNDRPDYLELAERLMMAQNNAGAAYEMLASQTGDREYRNQAMALYSRSGLSWDSRTRDPRSMIRSGSTPLAFINSRNALHPQAGYEPQIFIRIDRDVAEPSLWEELVPIRTDRF